MTKDMRIEVLTEKYNKVVADMDAMIAAAVDENGEERAFNEEEQAKFDGLQKNAENLKKTIEAETRAREAAMVPVELEKKPEEKKDMTTEERALAEERAFADLIRGVVSEERAGAVNLTKADGQVTIPTTIANKIITKVYDICPIARMATRYNIKGTLTIPFYPAAVEGSTPDITMAYADEFSELESTRGVFDNITLQGFLSGVLTKISKSLINNSQFDIVSFVVDHMAENIARWLEKELLIGTNNKIAGLSGITQTVTAGSTSAITTDKLIDLQDSIKDAFQANACWIMSPSTRNVIKKLKDGQGNYILEKDFSNGLNANLLLGKPVYISDNMPAIASGAKAIYYGDFSGLALKISEDINIEILREKYATEHAIGVVGYMECDAKVENAQKLAALVMSA